MIKDIIASNEEVRPNTKEMEILKENFPACFKEDGSFDIERFKEYLSDKVAVTKEGYELKFLGKNYARLLASLDTTTVIVPDEEHNSKPENINSQNVYISGDNLDGLKHLLKSYSKKIKCIYIDPPYNTGSDGFVYNDKFNFTPEDLADKLSISMDEAKRILDLTKRGSASHSAWLLFMYSRLLVARDLLKDNGAIFISIDNNEFANLKLICDDVFGENNYIGDLVIKTATDNNPTQINMEHEYMLCYSKCKDSLDYWYRKSEAAAKIQKEYERLKTTCQDTEEIQQKLRSWIRKNKEELDQVEHYNNVDERGVYSSSSNPSNPHPGGYMYDILHPITNLPCPRPENGWRWPETTFEDAKNNGDVCWGEDETTQPHIKKRIETAREQLKSIIYKDNRSTTNLVRELFGNRNVFDNPKPHDVIKRIIEFITNDDDIVLDFFSGSSTTAQSIMESNIAEKTKKRYILIQLPEMVKSGSEAKRAGYNTIDQIGIDRIKFAAEKYKIDYPDTKADLGFRHFTLAEPSDDTLDKLDKYDPADHGFAIDKDILKQFGVNTVLHTWLVRDGYGLTAPVQTIDFAGYSGYYLNKHLYLINPGLSDNAIATITEKYETDGTFNPENVIVFGYSFLWSEMDSLRINLARLKDTEKNLRINIDVRY
ncbi:site-specific DNA-methyltransferase [bacterium]|nr:site-specific DNA-methyltransferase [bacterium]